MKSGYGQCLGLLSALLGGRDAFIEVVEQTMAVTHVGHVDVRIHVAGHRRSRQGGEKKRDG